VTLSPLLIFCLIDCSLTFRYKTTGVLIATVCSLAEAASSPLMLEYCTQCQPVKTIIPLLLRPANSRGLKLVLTWLLLCSMVIPRSEQLREINKEKFELPIPSCSLSCIDEYPWPLRIQRLLQLYNINRISMSHVLRRRPHSAGVKRSGK
jgi:hypothetical protein